MTATNIDGYNLALQTEMPHARNVLLMLNAGQFQYLHTVADASHDGIYVHLTHAAYGAGLTGDILSQCLRILTPRARVMIHKPVEDYQDATVEQLQQVKRKLWLAGYTDVRLVTENVDNMYVCADKPDIVNNGQQPLKFATTTLNQANGITDTNDLIDENELLLDEDRQRPDQSQLKISGCSDVPTDATKPRKACKNCSCGLAETLANGADGGAQAAPTVKSACGSCYLGDAFRCSTCPHKGTPPFKPGEQVILQLTDDF